MAIESVALPKLPLDAIPEARFYIPATGPTRPRRVLKHGDTFVVVDSHGDIGASPGGTDGLFHCDTRFLSHLELLLNGMQPLLLGSNVRDDNTQLTVDLTNPDIYFDQRLILPKDTVHVVRTIFLWGDTAYQRIAVRNYGDHAIDLRLSLLFDSDFADLFEVRGLQRTKHGHAGHSFRARPGGPELRRARRQAATNSVEFRSAAHGVDGDERGLCDPSAAKGGEIDVLDGQLRQSDPAETVAVPARVAQGPPRAHPQLAKCQHRRQLKRHLQRGHVQIDGRSLHADD